MNSVYRSLPTSYYTPYTNHNRTMLPLDVKTHKHSPTKLLCQLIKSFFTCLSTNKQNTKMEDKKKEEML